MNFVTNFFKSKNKPKVKVFALPVDFRHDVVSFAQHQKEVLSLKSKLEDLHQFYLEKNEVEYRQTLEYKFLSECFNSVPDLALRYEYRRAVLNKAAA